MQLEQPISEYTGKPQIEDGHTKIANELLDAMTIHDFTKRQLVILLFIMRKTYGWNKSEDDISRSQIVEATGLKSPHITTAIQELQRDNVLVITHGVHAKRYKLNKFYDTWRVTKRVTITESVIITKTVTITETVTENYQNGNNPLPKQYPQKTITKDNYKRKQNKIPLSEYIDICKSENKKVIPENDSVFLFIEKSKIPIEYLRLAWLSFRDEFVNENNKKQASWPQTFRNYVIKDYLKIWAFNRDGECYLTTKGKQLENYYMENNDG